MHQLWRVRALSPYATSINDYVEVYPTRATKTARKGEFSSLTLVVETNILDEYGYENYKYNPLQLNSSLLLEHWNGSSWEVWFRGIVYENPVRLDDNRTMSVKCMDKAYLLSKTLCPTEDGSLMWTDLSPNTVPPGELSNFHEVYCDTRDPKRDPNYSDYIGTVASDDFIELISATRGTYFDLYSEKAIDISTISGDTVVTSIDHGLSNNDLIIFTGSGFKQNERGTDVNYPDFYAVGIDQRQEDAIYMVADVTSNSFRVKNKAGTDYKSFSGTYSKQSGDKVHKFSFGDTDTYLGHPLWHYPKFNGVYYDSNGKFRPRGFGGDVTTKVGSWYVMNQDLIDSTKDKIKEIVDKNGDGEIFESYVVLNSTEYRSWLPSGIFFVPNSSLTKGSVINGMLVLYDGYLRIEEDGPNKGYYKLCNCIFGAVNTLSSFSSTADLDDEIIYPISAVPITPGEVILLTRFYTQLNGAHKTKYVSVDGSTYEVGSYEGKVFYNPQYKNTYVGKIYGLYRYFTSDVADTNYPNIGKSILKFFTAPRKYCGAGLLESEIEINDVKEPILATQYDVTKYGEYAWDAANGVIDRMQMQGDTFLYYNHSKDKIIYYQIIQKDETAADLYCEDIISVNYDRNLADAASSLCVMYGKELESNLLSPARCLRMTSAEIGVHYSQDSDDNQGWWTVWRKTTTGWDRMYMYDEGGGLSNQGDLIVIDDCREVSSALFNDSIEENIEGWGGGANDCNDKHMGLDRDPFGRFKGQKKYNYSYISRTLEKDSFDMPMLVCWFSDNFDAIDIGNIELEIVANNEFVAKFTIYGLNDKDAGGGYTVESLVDYINDYGFTEFLTPMERIRYHCSVEKISYLAYRQSVQGLGAEKWTAQPDGDRTQNIKIGYDQFLAKTFKGVLFCINAPFYNRDKNDGGWLSGGSKEIYTYPTFMFKKFSIAPSSLTKDNLYGFVTVEKAALTKKEREDRKILHYLIAPNTYEKLNNKYITSTASPPIGRTKIFKSGMTSKGAAATSGIMELFRRLKLAGTKSFTLLNVVDNATKTRRKCVELGDTIVVDYTQYTGEDAKEVLIVESCTVEIDAEKDSVSYSIEARDYGGNIIGSDILEALP